MPSLPSAPASTLSPRAPLLLATGLAVTLLAAWPTPIGSYELPKAALAGLLALLAAASAGIARPSAGLLLLLALAMLATAFAPDPWAALAGAPPRAMGLCTLAAAAGFGLAVPMLDEPGRRSLLRAAHLALVLLAGQALLHGLGVPLLPTIGDGRFGGSLGNPVHAAALAAAVGVHAAFDAGSGPKWRALVLAAALAVLAVSGVRAGWLAFGLGLALGLVARPGGLRPALLCLVLAATALAAIGSHRGSDSLALRGWIARSGVEALLAPATPTGATAQVDRWHVLRPLLGHGADNQRLPLEAFRHPEQSRFEAAGHDGHADRAHLLPLDFALCFGLPALALSVLLLGGRLRAGWSAGRRAEVLALLTLLLAITPAFPGPAELLLLALWLGACQPGGARPLARRLPLLGLLAVALLAQGWHWRQSLAAEALRARLDDPELPLAVRRGVACTLAAREAWPGRAGLYCAELGLASGEVPAEALAGLSKTLPAHPRVALARARLSARQGDWPATDDALVVLARLLAVRLPAPAEVPGYRAGLIEVAEGAAHAARPAEAARARALVKLVEAASER